MKKILVFDDDTEIISILNYIMDEHGWKLFSHTNCKNLLEKVRQVSPDLILMDHWVPDIGGIVATQDLKKQKDLQHIPVVYFSAINQIEKMADEAGADTYIAKPFDLSTLENTLAFLLGENIN